MQQYFIDQDLKVNETIVLDKEIIHHLRNVLRKGDDHLFRLAASDQKIYLATLKDDKAYILERLDEDNELKRDITAVVALIKNDHFDLIIQKLTELGVSRIVPLITSRVIIKIKDEDKKIARYQKIAKEAAEQSHRNVIPSIERVITLNSLDKYRSDHNYIAYEKCDSDFIDLDDKGSITYVIGPEGGFSAGEIELAAKLGFKPISLGKRILRAETAAIFVAANIAGANI